MEPAIADSVQLLGQEICRILASPYALSLEVSGHSVSLVVLALTQSPVQRLREVVTSVASDALHLWAAGNGCRLETLASVISDEAQRGTERTAALAILDRLCKYRA